MSLPEPPTSESKNILLDYHGTMPPNVVCVQPNNSKAGQFDPKMEECPSPQQNKKAVISRRPSITSDLTILAPKTADNTKQITAEKKVFLGDNGDVNVEQFLNNLNINPTNLGQLISQKLPGVEHKIVNIAPGPTAGHIVAKIDIGSDIGGDSTQSVPPLISVKPSTQETGDNIFNNGAYLL